jgi:hypothetical protein
MKLLIGRVQVMNKEINEIVTRKKKTTIKERRI